MNLDKYTFPKMETSGSAGLGAVTPSVLAQARSTLVQANDVANRILILADKLCGPKPEACSSGGYASEPPMGELERFRAEMRDTRQAMIFADDALTRIEQELIG